MGIIARFLALTGLNNNGQTIINVADPVNAQDVATKHYATNASNLTSGTVPAAVMPAFTGDATSTAGSTALTLANSGVSAGTYGQVTVDVKGRITSGATTDVSHGGTGVITITGIIKGSGTSAFTAAVAGTDYAPATSGSSILSGNSVGGFANVTVGSGLDFTSNVLTSSSPPNLITNSNMSVAQRATTFALTTAATYGSVDMWAGLQAGTANGILDQATGSNSFQFFAKIGRNSGAVTTGKITLAQVLETFDSVPAQNQSVTFSFYAKKGANFSGASSNINVILHSGTGTDQSVAAMIAGTWTGASSPISVSQALTTTLTRYSFTGSAPSGCTQLGVTLDYTPVGTAGADDNLYVTGVQLIIGANTIPYVQPPYSINLLECRRYCVVAACSIKNGAGGISTLRSMDMRAIPVITGGGTGFTSTGTTKDSLIGFQNSQATQTLTLSAEL